jgi:putative oxidoreductase
MNQNVNSTTYNPTLLLVGRILVGALFIVAGARKIMGAAGIAGTAGYFAKLGFPAPEIMAWLAVIIEIGGGLLLIIGWRTRWVAWLLALFVIIATFAAHRFWDFPDPAQYNNQLTQFLKNASIIGGLLYVAAFGAGRASVDKA